MTERAGGRFWALCAATFFEFVSLGMFLVTIPLLVTEKLDGSNRAAGLAVGSFAVTALLARPWIGRQLDHRGRKPFVLMAPLVLLISSIGLANAPSIGAVIGLRLFQGLAAAGFYTGAASMATDLAGTDRRAHFIARVSLFLYGGFTVGPNLAEWLIDAKSFGWAWAAAATSAAISAGFVMLVPETAPSRPADAPVLMGRARILHPAAVGPGVVLLGAAVGYTTITAFSALFARDIGMKSSGAMFAAFAVTILGVRIVSGRLADRYGRFRTAFPGLLAGATGLAILATVPKPWLALIGVALYGAGFAFLFPALMALAADRAPEEERGAALGTFTAFFDVATATSGAIIGAIVDARGFGTAWAVTSVLCLLSAALLVRLHVRERGEGSADDTPLPEPAGT
jgi:MFS family permease